MKFERIAEKAPPKKRCPNCGKPRDAKYDPFCCRRCAEVDLHRWLKGSYVIAGGDAGESQTPDDEEA